MTIRIAALGALATLAIASLIPGQASAQAPRGIGVLGDSYSDEYREYPPHCSRARNWVEFLAESRGLNFGGYSEPGPGRGEPRNRGFAYNWARYGATTSDLIRSGQHLGLARQVAAGEVDIVAVFIGGNDFINAAQSADPDTALARVLPVARVNLRAAVDAVASARPDVRIVLITVPDIRDLPEFRGSPRTDRWSDTAEATLIRVQRSYNDGLKALAAGDPRFAVIDLDRVTRVSNYIAPTRLVVGNRAVDRLTPDDDPAHFFLGDRRHIGSVAQAMMARLFVDKLNMAWKVGLPPIRDDEVLSFADDVYRRTSGPDVAASSAPPPASPASNPVDTGR